MAAIAIDSSTYAARFPMVVPSQSPVTRPSPLSLWPHSVKVVLPLHERQRWRPPTFAEREGVHACCAQHLSHPNEMRRSMTSTRPWPYTLAAQFLPNGGSQNERTFKARSGTALVGSRPAYLWRQDHNCVSSAA